MNALTIEQINNELRKKNLDEKINWFVSNYKKVQHLVLDLTEENLFAFTISRQKVTDNFSTLKEGIEKEIIHLKHIIGKFERGESSSSVTAIEVHKWKTHLKYLESIDSKRKKSVDLKKVIWNGSQKELAELFIELQKKNWIDEIDMSRYDFDEIAENICNLFDITKTKRKKESDQKKSFYQILKGQPDEDNKTQRVHPQVYSSKYKKKFDLIKSNKS